MKAVGKAQSDGVETRLDVVPARQFRVMYDAFKSLFYIHHHLSNSSYIIKVYILRNVFMSALFSLMLFQRLKPCSMQIGLH